MPQRRELSVELCMSEPPPALSLVAVPGRRQQTLDLVREIERRGFAGIYVPSREWE
jgi:hypothetical protein